MGLETQIRQIGIFLGGMRCGSTATLDYMRQHPNVCIHKQKAPHFFSSEGCPIRVRLRRAGRTGSPFGEPTAAGTRCGSGTSSLDGRLLCEKAHPGVKGLRRVRQWTGPTITRGLRDGKCSG